MLKLFKVSGFKNFRDTLTIDFLMFMIINLTLSVCQTDF